MGKNYVAFYFPEFLIKAFLILLRKKSLYDQIFIDSRLDVAESLRELGWTPQYSFDQNIKKMFRPNISR